MENFIKISAFPSILSRNIKRTNSVNDFFIEIHVKLGGKVTQKTF